jgi:hypothetical protein
MVRSQPNAYRIEPPGTGQAGPEPSARTAPAALRGAGRERQTGRGATRKTGPPKHAPASSKTAEQIANIPNRSKG